MYAKYRIYIHTSRESHLAAFGASVNGLANTVKAWLENTPEGRSIYDDQVRFVEIYVLDEKKGSYVSSEKVAATSRKDLTDKLYEIGAR
jgi:hypothetical protein